MRRLVLVGGDRLLGILLYNSYGSPMEDNGAPSIESHPRLLDSGVAVICLS
jgi:hypothetical protein